MRLQRFFSALLFLTLAVFSLSGSAQEREAQHLLGYGDSIRITVYQNPDLTLETRISENGMISYPLLGMVKVGGMTIRGAEQTIARALERGHYIKGPQVNVQLLFNRSSQVSVLGKVNRPGRYPLETLNTRLSEMLAIAGGISPDGADIVIITGTRDGKPFRKEIDIAGMFLDKRRQGDDMLVAGGDVIFVKQQPRFYIYGEVQKPGSYRVERNMTIRQALAEGGGLSARGTERGLTVYRRGPDGAVGAANVSLGDLVQADDVLHVSESIF